MRVCNNFYLIIKMNIKILFFFFLNSCILQIISNMLFSQYMAHRNWKLKAEIKITNNN